MTKIYVGTLPFSATDAEVRELFAQHGTVESVSIITDRDTGRPRGFGFVEMSRADSSRAIQNINGKALGGRALRENEAQERSAGNRGGGGAKRWDASLPPRAGRARLEGTAARPLRSLGRQGLHGRSR